MPWRPAIYGDGGVSLVSECDSEYRDPYDRRFQLQPAASSVMRAHLGVAEPT